MWVTVYTDASYRKYDKHSSIAYYIRCDKGLIKDGEKLNFSDVRDNNEAEMLAIQRAIKICFKNWANIIGIQVNTDSMVSRNVLKYNAPDSSKYKRVQQSVRDTMRNRNCYLKIKHVPAHQEDDGIRTWLNNWCDLMAKQKISKVKQNILTEK